MTAHKSQGQTMTKVIVDLQSCRGTEAPYIMISCVMSLDGLLILCPFNYAKISCRQSQDTRTEMRRLKIIWLKTIAEVGTSIEKETAKKILSLHTCPEPSTNKDAENTENPVYIPIVSTTEKKDHKRYT